MYQTSSNFFFLLTFSFVLLYPKLLLFLTVPSSVLQLGRSSYIIFFAVFVKPVLADRIAGHIISWVKTKSSLPPLLNIRHSRGHCRFGLIGKNLFWGEGLLVWSVWQRDKVDEEKKRQLQFTSRCTNILQDLTSCSELLQYSVLALLLGYKQPTGLS